MSARHGPRGAARRALAAVLGAALLAACGGAKGRLEDSGGGPHDGRPGMGDSTAAPTGTVFALPAGLALAGDLEARNERCEDAEERHGSGTTVWLCLGLVNAAQGPITVRLPPGLVVVSRDVGFQNGVLLQEVTIVVPPGGTTWYALDAYCLNHWRSVPLFEERYRLGPVTDDPDVLALAALLEGKLLPEPGSEVVQTALWSITDGDGLSDADRAALAALPEAPGARAR